MPLRAPNSSCRSSGAQSLSACWIWTARRRDASMLQMPRVLSRSPRSGWQRAILYETAAKPFWVGRALGGLFQVEYLQGLDHHFRSLRHDCLHHALDRLFGRLLCDALRLLRRGFADGSLTTSRRPFSISTAPDVSTNLRYTLFGLAWSKPCNCVANHR